MYRDREHDYNHKWWRWGTAVFFLLVTTAGAILMWVGVATLFNVDPAAYFQDINIEPALDSRDYSPRYIQAEGYVDHQYANETSVHLRGALMNQAEWPKHAYLILHSVSAALAWFAALLAVLTLLARSKVLFRRNTSTLG